MMETAIQTKREYDSFGERIVRFNHTTAAIPAGAVKVSAKIYHGGEWKSMRSDCIRPIATAAMMLARWSEVYGRPEAIDTDTGCKFWLRDDRDYNALVEITGAHVNELRAAYKEAQA